MKPIRVLLVDDNLTFLHIATGFVQQQKELVLVGTAQGGEEALARAPIMRPQVVLLDLVMPGLSGYEIIPRLREVLPKAGVIMLSLFDSDGYREAALAAGADDFVSKRSVAGDLMPAIRRVAQARKANGPTWRKIRPGAQSDLQTDVVLFHTAQTRHLTGGGETASGGATHGAIGHAEEEASMDAQAQPQPIRILVVEDNPGDVRLTQMALKASRLYVMADVVATGPEALAYLRREDPYSGASPPDLILIDLVLPGLSGYEIIPRLHELSPEAGIIMVTMFDSDGYRKAALAAGADDFVSKQSVAGDLMPAIHRVARGRKAQQPEGRKVHITH